MTRRPPRCRKKKFPDRLAALLALAVIARADASGRAKSESRAYQCPKCHRWHLTSLG